jgi:hypothetical protein
MRTLGQSCQPKRRARKSTVLDRSRKIGKTVRRTRPLYTKWNGANAKCRLRCRNGSVDNSHCDRPEHGNRGADNVRPAKWFSANTPRVIYRQVSALRNPAAEASSSEQNHRLTRFSRR